MRIGFAFTITLFIFYCCNGQCVATNTILNVNPTCGDEFIGVQSSGIIKIKLVPISSSNKNVFSTVGQSSGDTFLELYDSANNLITSNDDDPTCGDCKQSTITYGPITGGGNVSGLYLILSKPGCSSLNFSTDLKYSARNEYDLDPKISSPISTIQCVGSTVDLLYDLPTGIVADNLITPWSSENTTVAIVDNTTRKVNFISNGIAKIKLSVKSSCVIINDYIIKGSTTSVIEHP